MSVTTDSNPEAAIENVGTNSNRQSAHTTDLVLDTDNSHKTPHNDETRSVAIQAHHSVSKIGENESGSGSFVCDFVVEDLRAVMQALNDFRGMVFDNDNDNDEDDCAAKDNDANVSE